MQSLSGIYKITLVALAVLVAGGAYFFYQSQAGTTVGLVSVEPGFVCGTSTVFDVDGNVYNTVQIGQQCWMKQNLRVGTRVSAATTTTQTNNGIIEKWCYGDTDASCTYVQSTTSPAHSQPDGGLYQWNEAMQYSTTPGAQGICPTGWHIPTHDEWTTLERAVCTTGSCATDFPYDTTTTGYRGTTEGTKLKPGGTSGFEGNLAGAWVTYSSSFINRGSRGVFWSSSEIGINAWTRSLYSDDARIVRWSGDLKTYGLSVRCLKDVPTTGIGGTLTTNPDLERGLVGHWTFDGPDVDWSSTTAEIRDRSGNRNHGNALSTLNVQDVTPGVLGQALDFTGTDNRVDIGSQTTLQMGTGDLSVSAWMKLSTSSSVGVFNSPGIFGNGAGSTDSEGYAFHYYFPDSRLGFRISDGTTRINAYSSTNLDIDEGVWYHVAVTADRDGNADFYLNSSYIGSHNISSYSGTDITSCCGDIMRVGAWVHDAIYDTMKGSLDDVRIYNRALSAEEVKRLYGLGATTKVAQTITSNPDLERGLVGHWTFDGPDVDWSSTTAEIRDVSGQGNHGNATTTMSTQSVTGGVLGQAMSLSDTVSKYIETNQLNAYDSLNTGTVSVWLMTSSTTITASQTFLSYNNLSDPIGGVMGWELHSSGQLRQYWKTPAGPWIRIGATTSIESKTWYHVTFVADGVNRVKLYLNGQELETSFEEEVGHSGTDTDFINDVYAVGTQNHIFTFGIYRRVGYYDAPFEGSIDDVRIYNRALSAEEVKRLYELGN